jgi:hypothetical protein
MLRDEEGLLVDPAAAGFAGARVLQSYQKEALGPKVVEVKERLHDATLTANAFPRPSACL